MRKPASHQRREQEPEWLRMFEGVEPMGRGRAKAKQVKVARQLKYNSGGTDLDRLRTELGVGRDDEGGEGGDAYADLGGRHTNDAGDADDHEEDDDEDDLGGNGSHMSRSEWA